MTARSSCGEGWAHQSFSAHRLLCERRSTASTPYACLQILLSAFTAPSIAGYPSCLTAPIGDRAHRSPLVFSSCRASDAVSGSPSGISWAVVSELSAGGTDALSVSGSTMREGVAGSIPAGPAWAATEGSRPFARPGRINALRSLRSGSRERFLPGCSVSARSPQAMRRRRLHGSLPVAVRTRLRVPVSGRRCLPR